jgi:hypothetical protein
MNITLILFLFVQHFTLLFNYIGQNFILVQHLYSSYLIYLGQILLLFFIDIQARLAPPVNCNPLPTAHTQKKKKSKEKEKKLKLKIPKSKILLYILAFRMPFVAKRNLYNNETTSAKLR